MQNFGLITCKNNSFLWLNQVFGQKSIQFKLFLVISPGENKKINKIKQFKQWG